MAVNQLTIRAEKVSEPTISARGLRGQPIERIGESLICASKTQKARMREHIGLARLNANATVHLCQRCSVQRDGLNRSATYGATYFGAVAARFARPETTPLGLLLTFHHVPLNFSVALPWTASSTANATTLPLIQALYAFNARGLGEVVAFESEWDIVGGARATAADAAAVGAARFALVRKRLADAAKDARNFTLTAAEYFEQLTGVQPLAARQNQSEGRQGLR